MTRHANNGLRKLCDHPRRGWAKCDCPWHFNFTWKGTHYRFSLDKRLGTHVDSKSAAIDAAADLRKAIKAGKFGQPVAREAMTLRQLADVYLDRYVTVERAATEEAFRLALRTICATAIPRPTGGAAPLGAWKLTDMVTDTIERFREARRATGTGVVGTNRHLGTLRALYNWALRVGYVETSPFKRNGEAVVKLADEPSRSRRLDADCDEEAKLVVACHPHLRAVVECALETGMRRGEILSLQWSQVEGLKREQAEEGRWVFTWAPRAELVLPWTKTKTRRDRRIPISSRLRSLLEMRRLDPDGEPLGADRFVFGNEIGQRIKDVGRAWDRAVLTSHGVTPIYTKTANLSPDSRAALAAIDLHFHDLRREAGSRWLEGGVPLHTIRDWLGHTSIAQTSTYLAGTMKTQHDAMHQFEARRSALQGAPIRFAREIATKDGTGGRKRLQTAERREETPNETAVGREPTLM